MDHKLNRVADNSEIVLRPSNQKWRKGIVIALCIVALCSMIISTGNGSTAWFVICFAAIHGLDCLLKLCTRSYLRLHSDGFEQKLSFSKCFYRWDDVSNFRTNWLRFYPVQFDNKTPPQSLSEMIGRHITPEASALWDNYGLPTTELIDLMESYREKSTAPSSGN